MQLYEAAAERWSLVLSIQMIRNLYRAEQSKVNYMVGFSTNRSRLSATFNEYVYNAHCALHGHSIVTAMCLFSVTKWNCIEVYYLAEILGAKAFLQFVY